MLTKEQLYVIKSALELSREISIECVSASSINNVLFVIDEALEHTTVEINNLNKPFITDIEQKAINQVNKLFK